MDKKDRKKVHKLKEYLKHETEFEIKWNTMDKTERADWLMENGFTLSDGFETTLWVDLKRSIRKCFRAIVFNSILEEAYIKSSGCACVCCRRGFPHLRIKKRKLYEQQIKHITDR